MFTLSSMLAVVAALGIARAHTIITYPGWRGDSLHTNGTAPQDNPESRGIDYIVENDTWAYPWGMQWMYPCGGMPQTTNRTKWPVSGGAISVQPGWFPGHSKALIYVNIGIQEPGDLAPPNMSHPIIPPFQITGPNNSEYGGQWCIPQTGMPTNVSLQIGQNITLQVIETAQHGAALYSCVDLTLVDDNDPELEEVTPQNCYNSSDIGFNYMYTTQSLTATGRTSDSRLLTPPALLALFAATFIYALSGMQL